MCDAYLSAQLILRLCSHQTPVVAHRPAKGGTPHSLLDEERGRVTNGLGPISQSSSTQHAQHAPHDTHDDTQ
jgi:hypothetical protein